jgi:GntR family transcriptional repressor for pyruvate dehydrogenase complex
MGLSKQFATGKYSMAMSRLLKKGLSRAKQSDGLTVFTEAPMLVPVGRDGTLTEEIAGQLIKLIMSGRYKPGERLPSELEFAKDFRAGRGAVREALQALSIIGLVRIMRGKGTFVRGRETFLTHPLSLGVKAGTELRRLIEARMLVEVELAGLAAERANAANIESMADCIARMRKGTGSGRYKEYLDADMEFHFCIADAADNFILSQFMTLIRNLMLEWISESLSLPGVPAEALKQHGRIIAAIQAHDRAAARLAMQNHISAMAERYISAW